MSPRFARQGNFFKKKDGREFRIHKFLLAVSFASCAWTDCPNYWTFCVATCPWWVPVRNVLRLQNSTYMEELPEFALCLQTKAGLNGYAQVYGKFDTELYDKLMMDLMYMAHPSLLEDFKIILATVKILFISESKEGVEKGKINDSTGKKW